MARQRVQSPPQSPVPTEAHPRGRLKKKASDHNDITDSQQMLALGSLLQTSRGEDKETQQLREKVAGDQRTLRALLQQSIRHAENERTRRRSDIANIISTAFVGPSSDHNCPTYPGTSVAINPIYVSAAEMIRTSRGLIEEYDHIQEISSKAAEEDRPQVMITWQQDVEETRRLLHLGHRKGQRDVKKVLGLIDAEEMTEGNEDDGGGLTKSELDYGLIDTLRYAKRGVKRMVKGLPRDVEMD